MGLSDYFKNILQTRFWKKLPKVLTNNAAIPRSVILLPFLRCIHACDFLNISSVSAIKYVVDVEVYHSTWTDVARAMLLNSV